MSERTDLLDKAVALTRDRIALAKRHREHSKEMIREFLTEDAKIERKLVRLNSEADELSVSFDVPEGKERFDSHAVVEAFDGFIEEIDDVDFAVLRREALDIDREEEDEEE